MEFLRIRQFEGEEKTSLRLLDKSSQGARQLPDLPGFHGNLQIPSCSDGASQSSVRLGAVARSPKPFCI